MGNAGRVVESTCESARGKGAWTESIHFEDKCQAVQLVGSIREDGEGASSKTIVSLSMML
jgi:hypothetical protein